MRHQFKKDKGLLFILKKVFTSISFRIVGLLSAFSFTWLVASKFGAYSLGLMSANLAIINIGAIFLRLGINTHAVSYVARQNALGQYGLVRSYFKKTMLLYLVMGIVGTTIILSLGSWLGQIMGLSPEDNKFGLSGLFFLPLMMLQLNSAFLQAYKKVMAFSFFLNGGTSFFSLLIILPLLDQTSNLELPLYIQLASICLLTVISFIMIFRFINPFKPTVEHCVSYKKIIQQSFPMMITSAVHPLWNWGGVLILGIFAPISSVGVFQLLLKCSNLISLPLRAISTIMAPIISEEASESKESRIQEVIKKNSSLSFVLSLPIIVLTSIFAKDIMALFGTEFIPFWHLLIVLLTSKFINACYGPISIIFMMTGKENLQGKLSLIELSFYLIVTFSCSWLWGLEGATIALLVSVVFRNLLVGSQIYKIYHVYPLAPLHLRESIINYLKHG